MRHIRTSVLGLRLALQTHLLVTHEGIRVEGATATRALIQSLVIVVVIGGFIVAFHGAASYLTTAILQLFEVLWCFRARFALMCWFFILLNVPLLLARLDVDVEACRAVLTPTYVAHEGFWSLYDRRRLLIRSIFAFQAHTLVLDQSLGVEGTITPAALIERFGIVFIVCCIVIQIHLALRVGGTSADDSDL